MDRLRKHANTIAYLSETQPKIKKSVIDAADKEVIQCLCKCVHNILKGNVPLSKAQKVRLHRHKKGLRLLQQKRTPIKKKKAILQTGGFLPVLLAPLMGSVIAPLASSILSIFNRSNNVTC